MPECRPARRALAILNGSAPRLSTREARPKPNRPPTASAAVSLVVSPTLRLQHLTAIRLEQHVFHAERHGAETDRDQPAHRVRALDVDVPGFAEGRRLARCGARGGAAAGAAFLLPDRDAVQHDGHHRGALDHLDQPARREVRQQRAEDEGALAIMPNSSIVYISPTTFGRDSGDARSVASARPTVCVV